MESDPPAEAPLVCAECGRQPRQDKNAADEWRAYVGVDDELHVFCPECAGREFRHLRVQAHEV
jgi:DNA-directed RNA polymerase subunit RPC12/RpoP